MSAFVVVISVTLVVGFVLLSPQRLIAPELAPNGQTDSNPKAACQPAGCSGQLCVNVDKASDLVTTCEFLAEYACYKTAKCERQSDGNCGWTQNTALSACLKNPPAIE